MFVESDNVLDIYDKDIVSINILYNLELCGFNYL